MVSTLKTQGQRVWEGDDSTVAEARKAYYADRKEKLLPYATALYSFRTNLEYATTLFYLRVKLINYANSLLKTPITENNALQLANTSDVLSTYFEWMSRQKFAGRDLARDLRNRGRQFVIFGLHVIDLYPNLFDCSHTESLLWLTRARVIFDVRETIRSLDRARDSARHIKDPKQRVRVYAKLGMLYRKYRSWPQGYYWGTRALLVLGVPANVRAKAVAALLGIDR